MLPYSFLPLTTIESAKVNANFEIISRSGMMVLWPSDTIPDGWLLCNGQSVSKISYPDLFTVIGYQYGGAGDNFNLPDFRGKTFFGKDSSQTEFETLTKTGGAKTINLQHLHSTGDFTLTSNEIPSHRHYNSAQSRNTGNVSADHTHYINAYTTNNEAGGYGLTASAGFQNRVLVNASNGISSSGISANHTHGYDAGSYYSDYTGSGNAHNHGNTGNSLSATQSVLPPYGIANLLIKI